MCGTIIVAPPGTDVKNIVPHDCTGPQDITDIVTLERGDGPRVPPGSGLLDYYRDEAEKAKGRK